MVKVNGRNIHTVKVNGKKVRVVVNGVVVLEKYISFKRAEEKNEPKRV